MRQTGESSLNEARQSAGPAVRRYRSTRLRLVE
jgi:hypothetical protein